MRLTEKAIQKKVREGGSILPKRTVAFRHLVQENRKNKYRAKKFAGGLGAYAASLTLDELDELLNMSRLCLN